MFTLLCYMLVTESNITSTGMHANGFRQQPQVSQFQEVGPLLLIQTITHSSQALARLYAPPETFGGLNLRFAF